MNAIIEDVRLLVGAIVGADAGAIAKKAASAERFHDLLEQVKASPEYADAECVALSKQMDELGNVVTRKLLAAGTKAYAMLEKMGLITPGDPMTIVYCRLVYLAACQLGLIGRAHIKNESEMYTGIGKAIVYARLATEIAREAREVRGPLSAREARKVRESQTHNPDDPDDIIRRGRGLVKAAADACIGTVAPDVAAPAAPGELCPTGIDCALAAALISPTTLAGLKSRDLDSPRLADELCLPVSYLAPDFDQVDREVWVGWVAYLERELADARARLDDAVATPSDIVGICTKLNSLYAAAAVLAHAAAELTEYWAYWARP